MERFPPHSALARALLIAIATLHAAWTDAADLLIENVTIVSPEQPSPLTARHVLRTRMEREPPT